MNESREKRNYGNLSAGFVLIAIAVAILMAWILGNWIWFIPIVLIECGGLGLLLGVVLRRSAKPGGPSRSTSAYYTFWGSLLLILGLLWVVNDQYPGNLPAVAAAFIFWLAIMIIILARR